MEIFKTCFLMVGLMMLFVFVGGLIGGTQGMMIAFAIAVATNFFGYFFSDKMVLKRYNAQPVDERNARGLYEMVARLCQRANLKLPKIYIINDPVPNAFATGRNPDHAAVAVTSGLLDLMSENEIEAVIAHELSHIKHYDILTGSIAAMFAGAIAILANMAQFGAMVGGDRDKRPNPIVLMAISIIMPLVATIIQMTISRSREFAADAGAAKMTGHPEWLISALSKLEGYSRNRVMQNATRESAHLFIVNPFGGIKGALSNLFRTHPTTTDRIQRLNLLSQKGEISRYFEN